MPPKFFCHLNLGHFSVAYLATNFGSKVNKVAKKVLTFDTKKIELLSHGEMF